MKLPSLGEIILLATRFSTLMANPDAIATMISAMKENRTTTVNEKMELPAQQTEPIQSFVPYSNALQPQNPQNQYFFPPDVYNHLTNAVQIPNEQYAHQYKPFFNTGNRLTPHDPENSLKPSSKHFLIVSFIGLLLLFAILQNTILFSKSKDTLADALSSRRKRELISSFTLDSMTPEQEDVINEDTRVQCFQRLTCLQNRKLIQDFSCHGKLLAKYLTRNIISHVADSPGWDRLIEDAGVAGTRGDDCNILYRDCT